MSKAKIRSYDDPCGVARALDRIGERWALLIVRELLLGPKRFTDLREGLPSASPNVLSQRLEELTTEGIVQRRQLEPPSRAWVYELTPWGRGLEDVLVAVARWGARAVPIPRGELSEDALLLALRTTLDPERATGAPLEVELRFGSRKVAARIAHGRLELATGGARAPEAVITTDAATLRRVAFGDLPLAEAVEKGSAQIEGNARSAARFVRSFKRPAPALVNNGR